MWKSSLAILGVGIFTGIIGTTASFSQIKKQFSVEGNENIEQVELTFKNNSGTCFLKLGSTDDILNVYSNQEFDSYAHSFDKTIENKVCNLNLSLEDQKSEGLSQSISYRMFGKPNSSPDNIWKVFLTNDKTYNLDLNYGIGNANIDLAGLAVSKLRIYTGNADVNINYSKDLSNKVAMDTFFVKVDMGDVIVRKLNLSKSKNVIADIGFGNLLMDFSDAISTASNITGSVGAGNLVIMLPANKYPVKIKVNNSWLCRVKLTKDFKDVGQNTFVNAAYNDNATNVLAFDLDVSMGSIEFIDKK